MINIGSLVSLKLLLFKIT